MNARRNLILIPLFLILTLLGGCAARNTAPYLEDLSKGMAQDYAAEAPAAVAESGLSVVPASVEISSIERIVIKNADLSIVVKDPGDSMNSIGKMADDMGGYIVSSQVYKTSTQEGVEVPIADMTIRVPAEKLNEAIDQIKSQVDDPQKDVLSESISGQDVTKEYTDLQSRLSNLQNAEAQLKEIMNSATKTEDVLNTFNQLTQVQEQIEVIKGQIKYYDESSKLSSIHINIQSQESIQPLSIGGWQPKGVARDAVQALINALKFLANAAIWSVIFCLPIGVLIGVPAWFIIKTFRKWSKNRKAKQQSESSEQPKA